MPLIISPLDQDSTPPLPPQVRPASKPQPPTSEAASTPPKPQPPEPQASKEPEGAKPKEPEAPKAKEPNSVSAALSPEAPKEKDETPKAPEGDEAAERARAAFRLREHERKLKADRDALEAEKAAIAKEREDARKEREAAAQAAAQRKTLAPLSAVEILAKEQGLTVDAFLRATLAQYQNGGQPTVEDRLANAEKAAQEARERAEQVEREILAREQERQRQEMLAAQQAQYDEIEREFRDKYRAAITNDLPFLAVLDKDEVVERAMKAANEYAKITGKEPPVSELMAHLEKEEREDFQARAARHKYALQAPPAVVVDTTVPEASGGLSFETPPDVLAGQKALGLPATMHRDSQGRFVNNAAAASRPSTPVHPRDMTPEMRIKNAAAVIERRRRAAEA